MIEVKLDNSIEQFGSGVFACSIVEELGSKAKDFVGFKCNKTGYIYDLHSCLRGPVSVVPVIKNSPDHMIILRYDAAHILSAALKNLHKSKIAQIEVADGNFHIDFYCDKNISDHDFQDIENKMNELMKNNDKFMVNSYNKEQAIELFENNELAIKIIERSKEEHFSVHSFACHNILSEDPASLYAKNLHFKLLSVSGSSWDYGSEKLQRIYGTCWNSKEKLNNHLAEIEENLKWDHRILGKKMSMFHIDPEVASGMVFWLPNGMKSLNNIKQYLRETWVNYKYQEVLTPIVMNSDLWDKSGHSEMFKENMMFMNLQDNEYALKPMSCPAHINIFKLGNKSYRDLPYKLSEFGLCHRYEPSGSLQGLMRARSFTQDDAHVFVSEDQIEEVILTFCKMLKEIYKRFGFEDVLVCLATKPEKHIGDSESWSKAESALLQSANKSGLNCEINEGEGAFYGPKLEFSIKDKKGHVWQCGTVQVDFSLAKRLGATYTDEDSEKRNPIVIHHAVLGSLERFLGILLENTKGRLPDFVHPHPVVIFPIKAEEYANDIKSKIEKSGLYCEIDNSNQTLSYKIRNWIDQRVNYIIIAGKKEQENNVITLRSTNGEEEKLTVEEFVSRVKVSNE
ncbi:threonine--tRNA ligase [Candidatus Cytomitobacter indipagum]|uniref:Threonine--tRNA ligase n=1 Tax=Candidatus Cytomitobacter indipagum TaxID=2601575 RepID=A0A5C0UDS0_9PROT|nr:threonine--tRNA ligase [Candidatus Cytomitobacter indipagum]QEK37907.1 threonine--tRNA ligase [Candidatus Cytomitobacter indipagum]